jgi:predicted aconitase with swiveling domain
MATIKKIFEWLYYLIDNTITTLVDNDKIAKVKTRKTKGIDDIAARIVSERTEYRRETIVNILTMANAAKIEFLSQGEMVNDGVTIYEPAITGAFFDNTAFDEKVHRCVVNTRVTNDVHAMLRQVKGVYTGMTVENGGASIDGVADTVTGSVTGEVTPGKTVTVTGKKIRVIPEEGETVESCITYANAETGQIIAQEDAPVINDPSKIVLQLPMLPQGTYLMTLKTLYSSASTTLKAPRYITSKLKLEVKE